MRAAAHAAARRAAWATGLGSGGQVLLWWGTALGTAILAWPAVSSGAVSAPVARSAPPRPATWSAWKWVRMTASSVVMP